MKYSGLINSKLAYFRDTSLWQLSLYSNELKDFRQGIAGQWDDNAARDINAQYINPHEEDETAMRVWLDKKQDLIGQLSQGLDVLALNNDKIIALSARITKHFSDCDEDLHRSNSNFDFASNRKNDADMKIPGIIAGLRAANRGEFNPGY